MKLRELLRLLSGNQAVEIVSLNVSFKRFIDKAWNLLHKDLSYLDYKIDLIETKYLHEEIYMMIYVEV